MILDDYQKRVDQLFEQIKTTQRENIITAGKMIAETIDAGGNIYLSGICHSIEMDLFNRGGGPAFYRTFHYKLDVQSDARERDRSDLDTDMEGLGEYLKGIDDPAGRYSVCRFGFRTDQRRRRPGLGSQKNGNQGHCNELDELRADGGRRAFIRQEAV